MRALATGFAIVLILMCDCSGSPKWHPIEWVQPTATDYGYVVENPIRIGYHDEAVENIHLSKAFIGCLRNKDGEGYVIILQAMFPDTKYKPEYKDTFLGMPRRGSIPQGGIVDRYELVSESGNDSISLYFDIYHAEPIAIPKGLDYVCHTDSVQDPLLMIMRRSDQSEF